MTALFVAGTGTGVGKTVVTASIVKAMAKQGREIIAAKPFATGVASDDWRDDDIRLLGAALGDRAPKTEHASQRFLHPLCPLSAAEMESRTVDLDLAEKQIREMIAGKVPVLVEGVGGVAVPLTRRYLVSDFIKTLDLPVLLVARTDLGTINHTLLSVEHLRAKGCALHGLVFVRHKGDSPGLDEQTAPEVIAHFSGVPILGTIPWSPGLIASQTPRDAAEHLPWNCPAVTAILQSLEW